MEEQKGFYKVFVIVVVFEENVMSIIILPANHWCTTLPTWLIQASSTSNHLVSLYIEPLIWTFFPFKFALPMRDYHFCNQFFVVQSQWFATVRDIFEWIGNLIVRQQENLLIRNMDYNMKLFPSIQAIKKRMKIEMSLIIHRATTLVAKK